MFNKLPFTNYFGVMFLKYFLLIFWKEFFDVIKANLGVINYIKIIDVMYKRANVPLNLTYFCNQKINQKTYFKNTNSK